MRKFIAMYVGVILMSSILFEDGAISYLRYFIGIAIWFGTWIYLDYRKAKRNKN